MGINIVSISIYCKTQRIKLSPDSSGKFSIPNFSTVLSSYVSNSTFSSTLKRVTAEQLITDPQIKLMDPVLTLDDGSKMRVYQGGDPSSFLVQSISLIEKHDKKYANKKKSYSGNSYTKGLTYGSCGESDFLMLDWPDDDWY
jgi:hypothetical protein